MKFGKLAVLTFSLSLAGATAASAAPVTVSGSVALALAGVVAPYSLLPSAQKKAVAALFGGKSNISYVNKIIVTADKGLCGSFNTNVIKGAGAFITGSAEPCLLGLVGRKGRDFFGRRGFGVLFEQVGIFQTLRYQDAQEIAGLAVDAFLKEDVDRVVLVPEGRICTTMIELYQNEGIITEPAGALALSALDDVAEEIRGKTVVCVLSGGNNDVLRYPEILERSLVYLGRKHYFIIEFAQKPGQLRQFVDDALGPTDDIVRFEYIKKTNKERGAALVGIELKDRADLDPLLKRMEQIQLNFRVLGSEELLYQYLV